MLGGNPKSNVQGLIIVLHFSSEPGLSSVETLASCCFTDTGPDYHPISQRRMKQAFTKKCKSIEV